MGKRLLPFWIWPGHWGLSGSTKERAKIEYENASDPYQSELALAQMDLKGLALQRQLLEVERKYSKINEKDYLYSKAALVEDETEKKLNMLALDHEYGVLNETEYEKQSATIRKEPWVKVVHFGVTGSDVKQGDFELDWNEYFIKQLEDQGYLGRSEDEVIQQWFHEVCKNVALDVYNGVGDFNERTETEPVTRTKKTKIKKGQWEAE